MTVSKREDLRKKWLNVLKHVCRKGGAYSFDVKCPNKRKMPVSSISRMKIYELLWVDRKRKLRPGEFLQYSKTNQLKKRCKTTTKGLTHLICWIQNQVRWSFIIILVIIRERTIWAFCWRSVWNWKIHRKNQATRNKKWMSLEKEQYVTWGK